ncbi:hypothetical protein HNR45_001444 [Negativicoccus succinicivorans]|uniref:Uncharacterized protein n=1 Tax=Negativicoccus succinicivorans TaxID=620903 RepID=A0A841R3B0_9FIRM|nr:hypothetical protein [Negativicoccus succinicivorans]MBB6478365.1 hypothetical protein [Negativicoccus succinicivorans]
MDFESFDELNEDERIKAVEKFIIREVGTIQQNLHYQGYEEVTFSDILKAYEIMQLKKLNEINEKLESIYRELWSRS